MVIVPGETAQDTENQVLQTTWSVSITSFFATLVAMKRFGQRLQCCNSGSGGTRQQEQAQAQRVVHGHSAIHLSAHALFSIVLPSKHA